METNLWGRWIQTNGTPAAGDFTLTRAAADCPSEAATVEIAFEGHELSQLTLGLLFLGFDLVDLA